MNDYEDDYNSDECSHGVWYKEYCEDCVKDDSLYEKAQEKREWNHYHPDEDTE